MDNFIVSSLRALRSLFAPGMFGVFILCLVTSIVALIGFVVITGAFFTGLAAHMQGSAMAGLMPWVGTLGSALIAWFLFPAIMPLFASFFDERIARVIERHDYPANLSQHIPAFWPELLHDLRFATVTVLLNIIALPLYIFPLTFPFVFYPLNGYLLGREFFVMVARRHVPVDNAEALRKRYSRTVMAAGIVLTLLATIPIVNLFAPFWGIAVMVHLYHRLSATSPSLPVGRL